MYSFRNFWDHVALDIWQIKSEGERRIDQPGFESGVEERHIRIGWYMDRSTFARTGSSQGCEQDQSEDTQKETFGIARNRGKGIRRFNFRSVPRQSILHTHGRNFKPIYDSL